MINKTNIIAAAIVAAAAFSAVPAANASVAAGMSASTAATAATTTAATTNAPAGIVLAHGYGGHWHGGWGGWRPYGGYRRCRWLKRKARRTGRRYWWHRYYRCRNAFY